MGGEGKKTLFFFRRGVELTAVVGNHNIKNPKARVPVKFYHIHPGYNNKTLDNDIALLQVSSQVFLKKIQTTWNQSTVF